MISFISGLVLSVSEQKAIIKTSSGLGYEVHLYFLVGLNQEVELFTSQIFRENGQDLYGFKTLDDRNIFEQLLLVKGVGPRSAYSMIGALGASEVIKSIITEDKETLRKVPGVGPKASSQIILDLSDKFKKNFMDYKITSDKKKSEMEVFSNGNYGIFSDAILMCKEMGFKEDESIKIAKRILQENELKSSEELFRKIVKELAL